MMLASAIISLSCNRIDAVKPAAAVANASEICCLTVDLDNAVTKAVGQTLADEEAINNVSVFVFRTDEGAKLDASSYETEVSSVTLKCTVGQRRIYVLANAAEDFTGTVKCESDLLSQSSFLKDNGLDNFFMIGSTEADISGAQCKVSVRISRQVSSVRLEKITNMMDAKAYRADGLFVVNRIYLTNVVGKIGLDGLCDPSSLASEYWHAKNAAEENPLFFDDDIDAVINYGSDNAGTVAHTFYAFPNDCAPDESASWSQRSTMLVIEATLDGVKYYYPAAVGPLEANKQYIVTNFTIRRPGTLNPWECVHKTDASFEIDVVPWATPVTATEDL